MQPRISKCVPYCGTRNDQRQHQASSSRSSTDSSIIINNQPGSICLMPMFKNSYYGRDYIQYLPVDK